MTQSLVVLISWFLTLAPILDGLGHPIPRPEGFARTACTVALEHPDADPRMLASALDVIAAHEGAYSTHPRGYNDGGRSCGAFQTPCAITPMTGPELGLRQARIAARILLDSMTKCPAHPLSLYASGRCAKVRIADYYASEMRREASTPLPAVVEPARWVGP